MKRVLVVTYYDLRDSIFCAMRQFVAKGYTVQNYPLFQYKMDTFSKIPNYMEHFLQCIRDFDTDVVLWWYFGLSAEEMALTKKTFPEVKQVLFNWDDPFVWHNDRTYRKRVSFLDGAIPTCSTTLARYISCGVKYAEYSPPGFDPQYCNDFSGCDNGRGSYACDLSICCTNLYEDASVYPNQFVNRKLLVDFLYRKIYLSGGDEEQQQCQKISFHVYGPEEPLKRLYPLAYRGFCSYDNLQYLFSQSRINLCTHVDCTTTNYICERVSMILGSGGFLFVDPLVQQQQHGSPNKVLRNNYHCVFMSAGINKKKCSVRSALNQIWHQLAPYLINPTDKMKASMEQIRRNGREFARKHLTWKELAKTFDGIVSRLFFDAAYVKTTASGLFFDLNNGATMSSFAVPYKARSKDNDRDDDDRAAFDWEKYVELNRLNRRDIGTEEIAWCHWRRHGRKNGFVFCCSSKKKEEERQIAASSSALSKAATSKYHRVLSGVKDSYDLLVQLPIDDEELLTQLLLFAASSSEQ